MDLDPDRRLALAYVPAPRRNGVAALWRLDVAFGGALAGGREPSISRIRLAWWREALERLDKAPPPPEPVLQGLAAHVLGTASGAELAAMEEGWAALLGPLDPAALATHAQARGGALFALSARLLGMSDAPVRRAGELWALADLARRTGRPEESRAAREAAAVCVEERRWPRPLRPLGMLATLAARDLARRAKGTERQGSPARMLRMIRHRLTGI